MEAHCSELIMLFVCNILRSSANSSQVGSRTVGLVFSVSICICLLYRGEHLAYSTVQIKNTVLTFYTVLVCLSHFTHTFMKVRQDLQHLLCSDLQMPLHVSAGPEGVAVALG